MFQLFTFIEAPFSDNFLLRPSIMVLYLDPEAAVYFFKTLSLNIPTVFTIALINLFVLSV
jgi:hypothetical protein